MVSFFIPLKKDFQLTENQWDEYTLIIPCVSVGNVPQLTVDLLVNTFLKINDFDASKEKDLQLVGYIRSKHVYPFAGPDPFALHGSMLATSIQVFASDSKKLVIIQQRSPIYQEHRNDFYDELINWISPQKFSQIIFLSSSFDHYLSPDIGVGTNFPIKYMGSNLDQQLQMYLEEKLDINPIQSVDPCKMNDETDRKIHLPGSGSARAYLKCFNAALKSRQTKLICLVMYCSEGDNRLHSFKMADKIAKLINRSEQVLKLKPMRLDDESGDCGQGEYEWSVPFSWRAMFGDEPPSEIF
ncbi:hypothetical protein RDWZM_000010 [Blomia tropicalis]|uniref:Proteasome assembly chaperone 2 n=1 Tax=Blomia tropicalis TaxID=40697 RepID=A0A9Q0MCV8_BLOTA|nr:hypothetical protein RDWZM_000010 [Blomia tropicalis]